MNKTVTVNLGGIVFHIDENAFEMLQKYLDAIKGHFTSSEGRDEIMQDIEARLAEMFQEKIRDSKQVITISDVEQVTAQMGAPEDFAGEGAKKETVHEEFSSSSSATGTMRRRLFRNPDDKVLGGVCSGVAAYFDWDPTIIRLIWAILFFAGGTGFLAYIVMWIVVPEAKTTAEKLQMRGEPVNVSNIEKNVKEEMENLKKKVEEWSKDGGRHAGTGIGRFFEALGEAIGFFFKVLGKIILGFFVIIGIIICIAFFLGLLGFLGVPGIHISDWANNFFINDSQYLWAYIGLMLLIALPFLMLVVRGIGGIFGFKVRSKAMSITASSLWTLGLVICLLIGIRMIKEFKYDESISQRINLQQPVSDTLYLESDKATNEFRESKYRKRFWEHGVRIDEDIFESDQIELDITRNDSNCVELVKMMTASGATREQAQERASHTIYSFTQNDSLIRFDAEFKLPEKEKYRSQRVQLILKVPVGKCVYIDNSMRSILYNVENVKGVIDFDMPGHFWKMTDRGLVCLDCTGKERTLNGDSWVVTDGDSEHVNIGPHGVHVSTPTEDVTVGTSGVNVKHKHKK